MSRPSLRIVQSASILLAFAVLPHIAAADINFQKTDLGTSPVGSPVRGTAVFSFSSPVAGPAFGLLMGSDFVLGSPVCSGSPGTCSVPVTFTPKYPGKRWDVAIVRDRAGTLIGRMSLTGFGTGPQAGLSPGTDAQLNGVEAGAQLGTPVFDSAGNGYSSSFLTHQIFKISAVDNSVTRYAGSASQQAGYSGDGGPALSAQFRSPGSLAVDTLGNLFVYDAGNNVIRKIDAVTGLLTTVVGTGVRGHGGEGGPATAAQIIAPSSYLAGAPNALAVDSSGNLYFLQADFKADSDRKIYEVDAATQTLSVFAGTGFAGDAGDGGLAVQADIDPTGLAIDSSDALYFGQRNQGSSSNSFIRVIQNGIVSRFAGSDAGHPEDGYPALSTTIGWLNAMAFDNSGSMYFFNSVANAHLVRRLSSITPHVAGSVANSSFLTPDAYSVSLDPAGRLYIGQAYNPTTVTIMQGSPQTFPTVRVGQTSAAVSLLYYNSGNSTLHISGIQIGNDVVPDFTQTNTCGATLAPGATCTISVAFTPQFVGNRSAALAVSDDAPGSPRIVPLSGLALSAQQAALSSRSLDFGAVNGGGPAVTRSVTLSNPGTAPLGISSITVADDEFTLTTNCGFTLAAGSQCQINVAFLPYGNYSTIGAIRIVDDASSSPETVYLYATGQNVSFSAALSPLFVDVGISYLYDFGAVQAALPTPNQTLQITNNGQGRLYGFYVQPNVTAAQYRVDSNDCYSSLKPGSSCNMFVNFLAAQPGLASSTIQVSDQIDHPTGWPKTVTVEGEGIPVRQGLRGVAGYLRASADFDGDGKADVAIWRPTNGTWYISPSSHPGTDIEQQWGQQGDVPVPGDYDGDGKADIAVWRPANGVWYIIPSSRPNSPYAQQWGAVGDVPVVGDFDHDGKTDLAVWRPSTGVWYVYLSGTPGAQKAQQWGSPADVPVPGDYDGDGKTDFAVWRPSTGTWYILLSSGSPSLIVRQYGRAHDIPMPADYDGDGKTDMALWRPVDGMWHVVPSGAPQTEIVQQWGAAGDVPVTGDFSGNGKADFAVWRPSNANWYVLPNSPRSGPWAQTWGNQSDIVLATTQLSSFNRSAFVSWNPNSGIWTMMNGYNGPIVTAQWGSPGDIPLLADFDGDGIPDFVVWRPSTGMWFVRPSSNPSAPFHRQWGQAGDVPLIADFDGDRKPDFIVWRPSTGVWYILPSGNPSTPIARQWGSPGDIPFAVDYNSDSLSDLFVWRPSTGTWYGLLSNNAFPVVIQKLGTAGDVPFVNLDSFGLSVLGAWRPSTGEWFTPYSTSPVFQAGLPGDLLITFSQPHQAGYGGISLWRPTQNIVAPAYGQTYGTYGQPALILGTPLDQPL